MRRRPERRAACRRGVAGQLLAGTRRAPTSGCARRSRCSDCWKPTLPSVCIIAGLVKASASQITSGWSRAHVGDEPLPELDRLGVRVVDAEDLDPVVDPHLDHPAHLGVDARGVVVEVERVDVLVLLRRVLGVGDGAVGAGGEPLRVRRAPRGGRGSTAARCPWRPPAELARPARRRRRSRRTCRGRGGWRRGRRRGSRWRRGCRGRPGRRRGCCWGPCASVVPIGWIGVR